MLGQQNEKINQRAYAVPIFFSSGERPRVTKSPAADNHEHLIQARCPLSVENLRERKWQQPRLAV